MALHDPDLQKSFAANRRAMALSIVPETAVRNFEAMTVAERRYEHENAAMQAIRHDILARSPNLASADYNRHCADNYRKTAEALKAIGL